MLKLTALVLALALLASPAPAQTPCQIAGGAVRLHLASEACQLPLSERGKRALAAARTKPAVMACLQRALAGIKAELREALEIGGKPGIRLWCDLQRQTLTGMLE